MKSVNKYIQYSLHYYCIFIFHFIFLFCFIEPENAEKSMIFLYIVYCLSRDLVKMVLPEVESPFPHLNLEEQRNAFVDAGFHILAAEEAYRPIKFYDIGAFVWFAHIIEWEFPGFSVDKCFEQLLKMQKIIEDQGKIEGTIHRYLIAARK